MPNIDHPSAINRDYIRLLQVMRRFIREEFACDIRMTQKDAVEQMLNFSEQSRNRVLQEMAKELREFVHQPLIEDESTVQEINKVRYYRGAAISGENAGKTAEINAQVIPQEVPRRVYRGQVIGG